MVPVAEPQSREVVGKELTLLTIVPVGKELDVQAQADSVTVTVTASLAGVETPAKELYHVDHWKVGTGVTCPVPECRPVMSARELWIQFVGSVQEKGAEGHSPSGGQIGRSEHVVVGSHDEGLRVLVEVLELSFQV